MSLATVAVHLDQLEVLALPGWLGIQVALDVVLFIIAVMGGRVIPMFTNNGVAGRQRCPPTAGGEGGTGQRAGAAGRRGAAAAGSGDRGPGRAGRRGAPCALAAVAALEDAGACRWFGCCTSPTPGSPSTCCCARWPASAGSAPSAAMHALTVGAIGGMIIGMMTRTARGHTGRLLKADGWDVACYVLVLAAALVRVVVPLALPQWTIEAIVVSAGLWSSRLRAVCGVLLEGADAAPARRQAGLGAPGGRASCMPGLPAARHDNPICRPDS